MKFTIEHEFKGIGVDEYQALFFDEAFQTELCRSVNLGRELLKLDTSGGSIVRHVRCEPAREIPGPVAKVLGNEKKISYVEEVDFDAAKHRGTWKTISSVATDKVKSGGTIEFVATSDGVKRIVRGDISVSIFGLGGLVERFIVADVEKSYDDAAAFTTRWLADRRK